MDDVEFLERIVKNNKDFVAGQIASMIKDMKWKEKKFLLWKTNPERDGGRKENYRNSSAKKDSSKGVFASWHHRTWEP